jgi:hypothetical protein
LLTFSPVGTIDRMWKAEVDFVTRRGPNYSELFRESWNGSSALDEAGKKVADYGCSLHRGVRAIAGILSRLGAAFLVEAGPWLAISALFILVAAPALAPQSAGSDASRQISALSALIGQNVVICSHEAVGRPGGGGPDHGPGSTDHDQCPLCWLAHHGGGGAPPSPSLDFVGFRCEVLTIGRAVPIGAIRRVSFIAGRPRAPPSAI